VIVACWVGAVVAAATFGIATVSALRASAGSAEPLSQQEVSRRLGQESNALTNTTGPGQPTTGPPETATPTAQAARQYFTTSGGSLWATCTNGQASVDTMTPRQGYRLDSYDKGPSTVVWVKFKQETDHGHSTEYHVTVTCVVGIPRITETADG
jgi:hypothetical protein